LRLLTLRNLAMTDWGNEPVFVHLDAGSGDNFRERQQRNTWLALKACLKWKADYFLLLEDDLVFNRNIRHNLLKWNPLHRGDIALGSLYNPYLTCLALDPLNNCSIVDPETVYGSQAFILPRPTVEYLVKHWNEVEGMQDIKISRLAGRLKHPVYYHTPSLVNHIGQQSVWGGSYHHACDFDPSWRC
jgi:hypothetical protein